jgi:OOP family OmpA-OmpF porin
MKHSYKLLLAGSIFLAMSGVAHAETGKMYIPTAKSPAGYDSRAVVRSSNGMPVRSTSGNCVRTQWIADCDACAERPPQVRIPLAERTVYFVLNKSTLTPVAKKKLNALAETIKMHGPVKSVRIAGFADRLGSPVYNEKLSKRRADSVRKYLVSRGIINAQVVETRWFGDTLPATNCPKDLKRAALVTCLQRDRRVEVEVEFAAPGEVVSVPAASTPRKHKYKKPRRPVPKAMKGRKPIAK